MRRTRTLGLGIALVVLALVAAALPLPGGERAEAGGMWFAWLYSPQTDSFMRVWEDGTTQAHTLELAPGETMASSPRAFAPNGEWLAVCTFTEAANQDTVTQNVSLRVHDFNPDAADKAGMTFPVIVPLGFNTQCSVSDSAFNTLDQTRLAFGVLNYYPGDPNADLSRPQWELHVLDIASGQIVHTLNPNSPGAEILVPPDERWVRMPLVFQFEGDQVIFEMAPWGTEFLPGQDVKVWNLTTGAITQAEGDAALWGVIEHPATGERVWLAEDPSLPAAQPMGPMPAYNVIRYQHPTMAAPVNIYHDPGYLPLQPVFVHGGEALIFNAVPGFDPNADPNTMPPSTWTLLERSGRLTPLALGPSAYQVAGTRQGFVAWESNYEAWTAALIHHTWESDPTAMTSTVLWTSSDPNWSLAWSVPQPTGGDAMWFTAVTP